MHSVFIKEHYGNGGISFADCIKFESSVFAKCSLFRRNNAYVIVKKNSSSCFQMTPSVMPLISGRCLMSLLIMLFLNMRLIIDDICYFPLPSRTPMRRASPLGRCAMRRTMRSSLDGPARSFMTISLSNPF